ncbi:LysR family transcriptional regulator [Variovorax sp. J22G73]|uniref:LysR family transcriptional regulator n=1 Tax=unclassified Variovorax TaxID=663243 RepID=UPI0025786AAD|nr:MULTISPECIES: LysR family transcriptional regulator [unclassified Variovorax]MDM0004401.1 LysR family transcriptional regulator [Variovorax sp. J22R203]MDM0095933.1 LysR family transcriptional regulator [Variovorax sp. J22G73]
MTFKQLEALYWIGRLGGFAQAASQLNASQSAISKRVHELELLFDTELFDRSQRTARLTEKGEEMFVLAQKLLAQRDAAVEQFGKPGVVERRIRIGVTELTAMTWLPRLVGLIQQHYPKVILEPDVDDSLQLRDKLMADELDLVIVPDTFADSRLPHKLIGQVRSAWMCKPGVVNVGASGGTVRLHELARHRMLVQGNNSGTGRAYDAWMKEQGVQPANVIVVSNLVALTGLTVSGLGVSYLPRQCLEPLVAAGMLAVIDVTPALPVVRYVAMHKGEHRSALTSSIVMLAQACCDFTRMFQAQGELGEPGELAELDGPPGQAGERAARD